MRSDEPIASTATTLYISAEVPSAKLQNDGITVVLDKRCNRSAISGGRTESRHSAAKAVQRHPRLIDHNIGGLCFASVT